MVISISIYIDKKKKMSFPDLPIVNDSQIMDSESYESDTSSNYTRTEDRLQYIEVPQCSHYYIDEFSNMDTDTDTESYYSSISSNAYDASEQRNEDSDFDDNDDDDDDDDDDDADDDVHSDVHSDGDEDGDAGVDDSSSHTSSYEILRCSICWDVDIDINILDCHACFRSFCFDCAPPIEIATMGCCDIHREIVWFCSERCRDTYKPDDIARFHNHDPTRCFIK